MAASAFAIVTVVTSSTVAAQARPSDLDALKRLSIQELSQIEVTSVSRTEEMLGGAAAAIAVVTGDDIRRSGATSVPEALRGVPGIHVARRNSNSWAVAARGFSSINSEKLLVLSDTRSIYTPLFSGVSWDVQNYLLEDIERIEVIRGPGATQWGANAVNGVINITTRSARDTQGLYARAAGGSEEQAALGLRYGGRMGEDGHFRVSAQYFERDESQIEPPGSPDDWRMGQVGFRADWAGTDADAFTLQGDWYDGRIGQVGPAVNITGLQGPLPPLRAKVDGGNVLARWKRTLGAASSLELRAYYDHTHRDDPSFRDTLDTVDVDFQHDLALSAHHVSWGLNFRRTDNRNTRKVIFAVDPPQATDMLYGGFIQDQIALGDSVEVTVGTKLEENDFSGFEVQPSARLAWLLSGEQTVWASVSRAVRVPTRLERDVSIEVTPGADPTLWLLGNRNFDAERLLAWELGYRWQASPRLSMDMASFYSRYRGLSSLEIGDPFVDPDDGRTVFPIRNENLSNGRAVGGELLVTFAPRTDWRLTASYSYVDVNINPLGEDINRGQFLDGATPRHQLGLRSAFDLGDWQVDAFVRHLSRIRREPQIVTGEGIPGYTELDLRVAYLKGAAEFALVGQNLLHDEHVEFGSPNDRGGIERAVHASVTWRLLTD